MIYNNVGDITEIIKKINKNRNKMHINTNYRLLSYNENISFDVSPIFYGPYKYFKHKYYNKITMYRLVMRNR